MDSRVCVFYYGLLKKLRLRLASVDCHADKSARNDRSYVDCGILAFLQVDSRVCVFYYGLLKKLRLRLASVDCHADKSARNDRAGAGLKLWAFLSKVDSRSGAMDCHDLLAQVSQ